MYKLQRYFEVGDSTQTGGSQSTEVRVATQEEQRAIEDQEERAKFDEALTASIKNELTDLKSTIWSDGSVDRSEAQQVLEGVADAMTEQGGESSETVEANATSFLQSKIIERLQDQAYVDSLAAYVKERTGGEASSEEIMLYSMLGNILQDPKEAQALDASLKASEKTPATLKNPKEMVAAGFDIEAGFADGNDSFDAEAAFAKFSHEAFDEAAITKLKAAYNGEPRSTFKDFERLTIEIETIPVTFEDGVFDIAADADSKLVTLYNDLYESIPSGWEDTPKADKYLALLASGENGEPYLETFDQWLARPENAPKGLEGMMATIRGIIKNLGIGDWIKGNESLGFLAKIVGEGDDSKKGAVLKGLSENSEDGQDALKALVVKVGELNADTGRGVDIDQVEEVFALTPDQRRDFETMIDRGDIDEERQERLDQYLGLGLTPRDLVALYDFERNPAITSVEAEGGWTDTTGYSYTFPEEDPIHINFADLHAGSVTEMLSV